MTAKRGKSVLGDGGEFSWVVSDSSSNRHSPMSTSLHEDSSSTPDVPHSSKSMRRTSTKSTSRHVSKVSRRGRPAKESSASQATSRQVASSTKRNVDMSTTKIGVYIEEPSAVALKIRAVELKISLSALVQKLADEYLSTSLSVDESPVGSASRRRDTDAPLMKIGLYLNESTATAIKIRAIQERSSISSLIQRLADSL